MNKTQLGQKTDRLRKYIKEYVRALYDLNATAGAEDYEFKHPSDIEHPIDMDDYLRQEVKIKQPKGGNIFNIVSKGSFPRRTYIITFNNRSIEVPSIRFDKFADIAWAKVAFGIYESPTPEPEEVNLNANMFEEYLRKNNLKYDRVTNMARNGVPFYQFKIFFNQPKWKSFRVYKDNELITLKDIP